MFVGVLFGLWVATCTAALVILWVTTHKDFKKYEMVLKDIAQLRADVAAVQLLIDKNISSVGKLHQTCAQFTDKVLQLGIEVEAAQTHHEKLRVGQMELQEQISKKRPVVKFHGLIPVEMDLKSVRAIRKAKK